MLTQRKDDVRTQAREASKETRPADTLNLDFQSPKLPLFKPPSLWYFVTLALANQYNCFLHFENGLNHGHCPRWPHRPTSTQRRNREIWGRKEGGGRKPPRSPAHSYCPEPFSTQVSWGQRDPLVSPCSVVESL